jgi:radical SAM protein with 4Fe4S-binding SPASM domain
MPYRESVNEKKENIGIGFDITNMCNVRCRQCYFSKGTSSTEKLLTLEQIEVAVQKAAGKFSEMYVLGGEPTLHPQLPEILELGLRNFPTVILVTNGLRLADEEYCKRIALPGLSISMHKRAVSFAAERMVNQLAQNGSYFERSARAWRNVELFWKGDVNVQMNLLRPLVQGGHALEVFKWARKKGYEPIMELTKPGPIFERGNPLDVTAKEVEKLYRAMQGHDWRYFRKEIPSVLVPPSYGHSCTLIETGVHVYVDGTVVPCVAHNGITLGNIFTDNIEDILNSPIRKAIQEYKNWIVGPCRSCEHFEYCHGGCRGEAFWDTGCPRASDPYCWHLPKRLELEDMVPKTCDGCILENNPGCKIKI